MTVANGTAFAAAGVASRAVVVSLAATGLLGITLLLTIGSLLLPVPITAISG